MFLAVSVVARMYERLSGAGQHKMVVGLLVGAAACAVLEAFVVFSQPSTPQANGVLLAIVFFVSNDESNQ